MRYNIVHLIRGEAKVAHEQLTQDLADRFGVFPLHKRIPPHLTLKRGFESSEVNLEDLYSRLEAFAANHHSCKFDLKGWGHFPQTAIFVSAIATKPMYANVAELLECIRTMPGMHFHEYDNGKDFHASVAIQTTPPFDFEKVWSYVHNLELLDYHLHFDNIATLKKVGEVWVVDRVFELRK